MKQKKSDTLGLPDQLLSRSLSQHKTSNVTQRTGLSGRVVVCVIAIALVIAGTLSLFAFMQKRQEQAKTIQRPKEVTTLDTNEVPSVFPPDLPYTAASAVVHNYQVTANGRTETVRKWKVNASPAQVASSYKEYFVENTWEVTLDTDQQGVRLLAARKEISTLSVSIRPQDLGTLLEVVLK